MDAANAIFDAQHCKRFGEEMSLAIDLHLILADDLGEPHWHDSEADESAWRIA